MTETQCYDKLYYGLGKLVPHYKEKYWQHVCVIRKNGNVIVNINGEEDMGNSEFTVDFFIQPAKTSKEKK